MSWRQIRLGDVIRLKRGHDLPASDRIPGEIPIVSSSGVTGYHSAAKATGPGVVTGRYGTLGEVHYIEGDYWPLNTALYVEDFKGSHPRYVAYLLMTLELGAQNAAGAVPGVNRNTLHQMIVRVPDVAVQRRIACLLSTYDDLIATNQRRIALLEDAARRLYREWFVHLRFPGHESVPVKHGVPEGWQTKCLNDACISLEDGDWIESKDQGGLDFRLLQVSNVGINRFVETGNYRFISEDTFRRLRCREIYPGDFLISRMPDPIGRAWLAHEMPWRMVTAVDVAIAKHNPEVVDRVFLLCHLNSEENLSLSGQQASGATRPRISRKQLGALPIQIPPLPLQALFASWAMPTIETVNCLLKQNQQLARARDLLLPKLMSGQLDVSGITLPEAIAA